MGAVAWLLCMQAVQTIRESRRELSEGPAAARAAVSTGAPPVSETLLVGLGGADSRQQRGFAGLAGEGPAGVHSADAKPGTAGLIARASQSPHVTGLPDWRNTSGAGESLFNIKVKLDAGLGPLPNGQVSRGESVDGVAGPASGSTAFKQRAANVGRVQGARP